MSDEENTITLYTTGKNAGKDCILAGRYKAVKGEIKLPMNATGAIKILRKYYACSTKKPAVSTDKS